MATKTLLRSGASIATRFLNSANPYPSSTHQTLISSSNHFLSPSLLNSHSLLLSPRIHPNDAASATNLPFGRAKEKDDKTLEILKNFYPYGQPSIDFFLPDADDSSSDPMILFPKRPFQPSTLRRKRNHGFFARKATKGGRRVIARRVAKGRHRVTA